MSTSRRDSSNAAITRLMPPPSAPSPSPDKPSIRKKSEFGGWVKVERPSLTRLKSEFRTIETRNKNSAHEIEIVVDKEGKTYYFKKNPGNTRVSELEAGAGACYQVIDSYYIANTFAIYDSERKEYVGVASEEIPGFQSTADDKITSDDVRIDFEHIFDKKPEGEDKKPESEHKKPEGEADNVVFHLNDDEFIKKIRELDKLEKKFRQFEIDRHKLKIKKTKLIKIDEPDLRTELEETQDETKRSELRKKLKAIAREKGEIEEKEVDLDEAEEKFYKENHLNKQEFRKYRIIKGLAVALTLSWLHLEYDLHRKNFSKFGKRMDFDMSFFIKKLLYAYKKSANAFFNSAGSPDVVLLTTPFDAVSDVTAEHLRNFPVISTSAWWPTQPSSDLKIKARTSLHCPENAYNNEEAAIYQLLQDEPALKFQYYTVLTKYLLTEPGIYEQVLGRHVNQDESRLIDAFLECITERREKFQHELLNLADYCEFIKKNLKHIASELLENFDSVRIGSPLSAASEEDDEIEIEVVDESKECCDVTDDAKQEWTSNASLNERCRKLLAYFSEPRVVETESEKLIQAIQAEMKDYLHPPSPVSNMYYQYVNDPRTHSPLAEELLTFCREFKPGESDAANVKKIYAKLEHALTRCKPGRMNTTLLKLLNKPQPSVLPQSQSVEDTYVEQGRKLVSSVASSVWSRLGW